MLPVNSFRIKDSWMTVGAHTLPSSMDMFYIKNTGSTDLTFSINNLSTTLKPLEEFLESFDRFKVVNVTATSNFEALAGSKFDPPVSTVKDFFSGTENVTKTVVTSFAVVICNDGASALSYIVNGITINVAAGDVTERLFEPFTQIIVNTSVPFRAYVKSIPAVIDTTAPMVIASLESGSYNGTQTISLSADEEAIIYYTTDGSTPTTSSSIYSEDISIVATTTLKFFGKDTAGNSSTVQTAFYIVTDTTPPSPVQGLTAGTPTSNTVLVSWIFSPSSDVVKYEIAYSTDGGVSFIPVSSETDSSINSLTIVDLNPSTLYTIVVVAIDEAGNRSYGNPTIQVTTSEHILASDTFTRTDTMVTADSAITLGTTEVGGVTWTNTSIYWNYGIIGNKAYQQRSNSGGVRYRKPVVVPVTVTNYAVELTLSVIDILGKGNESIHIRVSAGAADVLCLTAKSQYSLLKTPFGQSEAVVGIMKTVPAAGDKIRIENYEDGRIRIYINNVLQHDVKDVFLTTTSVRVGFAADTNVARFDDFKLIALLPTLADTTPPAEVTGLSASKITQTSVTLAWTQPLDKDFRMCEIYNGTILIGTITPITLTQASFGNFNITGLSAGTNYTLMVKTKDWFGNTSDGVSITIATLI